jgi:hypothetical protein
MSKLVAPISGNSVSGSVYRRRTRGGADLLKFEEGAG